MMLKRPLNFEKTLCWLSLLAMMLLCLTIGGCGGTGGGGASGTLSFSPNPVNLTCSRGDSVSFVVTARLMQNLSGSVYVYIIDDTGVILPSVDIVDNGDRTYTVTMETDPGLPAGNHSGNFEIRLCEDFDCNSHHPGSPLFLPYEFNIIETTNLSPLTRWPGIDEWVTYQANAGHTGYVGVTLDSANFSNRWTWQAPDSDVTVQPVVTGGDRVYAATTRTPTPNNSDPSTLYALGEYDSSILWEHDFGPVNHLNPPALAAGKIFTATSGHSDTYMWSFDAATGTQLSSISFESQWDHYFAPTPYGDAVYTNGGRTGGVLSFSTVDGSRNWFTALSQQDEWTPAVDDQYLYAYLRGALQILNKDGSINASITDPHYQFASYEVGFSPVIPAAGKVLAVNGENLMDGNDLIRFDIAGETIDWHHSGTFVTNPVVADDVIYVANISPFQLEARDGDDGTLLWNWSPSDVTETGFSGNLIVTDNMVLLSTDKKVHAIDISTHASVWSHWAPGELALSPNGVLYIAGREGYEGILYAVNVK